MIPDARELMPDLQREAILGKARPFDPLTRLEDLTRRFPNAMRILEIGGVHPTKVIPMNNPYTGQPDSESFTNVGEHCLAVACSAEVLTKALALNETEAVMTVEHAFEHDTNKRIEVFRKKAAKTGIIPTNDVYSPDGYATIAPILRAQGFDQQTVEHIAKAGKETGHTSFKDFLTLQDGIPYLTPGKMVDKIVHLADDITSTAIPEEGQRPLTIYLTPWERMITSEFPSRYPDLWKDGLGFDPKGQITELKDIATADSRFRYARPYAYWQPFISNEICREIQRIIDPLSQQKPEYFIKELVNHSLIP